MLNYHSKSINQIIQESLVYKKQQPVARYRCRSDANFPLWFSVLKTKNKLLDNYHTPLRPLEHVPPSIGQKKQLDITVFRESLCMRDAYDDPTLPIKRGVVGASYLIRRVKRQ